MILQTVKRSFIRTAAVFSALALILASVASVPTVQAATPDTLYSYDFTTPTLTSPVVNGAAANTAVGLKLYGAWSQSSFGIRFDGNMSGSQSVAYAKPTSGNTISVAANKAFGGAIKFKYQAPTSANCFSDSRNLAQIGRFGAGLAQIKIQFSNCGKSSSQVFPECRMAGANSTTNDLPVTGTQALVNGETYIVKCTKDADPATGKASLQLKTTRVDAVNGNQVTTDNFLITRTGLIQSTAYLSVGNKYALPSPNQNTDQFVGDVAKVSYCASSSLVALNTCLETEIPEGAPAPNPDPEPDPDPEPPVPPAPPAETQFVGNPSLETDLLGWTGLYSANSQNTRVADGYDGTYSLRSFNKGTTSGAVGFIDKLPRWMDGTTGKATVLNKIYTGSVWVKPDVAGQKINLYLRETNAAGTTVGSKTVTVTTATTDWVQVVNAYTAKGTGNSLGFYVYGSNIGAQKGFNADKLSLSVPN